MWPSWDQAAIAAVLLVAFWLSLFAVAQSRDITTSGAVQQQIWWTVGRGVVLATLWGRELARHAAGTPAHEFVLPPSVPKRLWLHPVARPLVTGLIKYYALRDAIEDRRLERGNDARPKSLSS